jgi:hypothetical protein
MVQINHLACENMMQINLTGFNSYLAGYGKTTYTKLKALYVQ